MTIETSRFSIFTHPRVLISIFCDRGQQKLSIVEGILIYLLIKCTQSNLERTGAHVIMFREFSWVMFSSTLLFAGRAVKGNPAMQHIINTQRCFKTTLRASKTFHLTFIPLSSQYPCIQVCNEWFMELRRGWVKTVISLAILLPSFETTH